MQNSASMRMVRHNRWVNFKMDFLVCECFQLVVEENIKLGKKLKEILALLRCKVSAQICDCLCVTSLMQTIQCFCSKVIVKRESIFIILFVLVKTILQKTLNGSSFGGIVGKFMHGNMDFVTHKMTVFEIKLCPKSLQNTTTDNHLTATFSMEHMSLEFGQGSFGMKIWQAEIFETDLFGTCVSSRKCGTCCLILHATLNLLGKVLFVHPCGIGT